MVEGGAQKSLHLACINGPAVGKAEGFKCVAVVGTARTLITLPWRSRLR